MQNLSNLPRLHVYKVVEPEFGPTTSDSSFLKSPLSECSVNGSNDHYCSIAMKYYHLKFKGTSGYCPLSKVKEALEFLERIES